MASIGRHPHVLVVAVLTAVVFVSSKPLRTTALSITTGSTTSVNEDELTYINSGDLFDNNNTDEYFHVPNIQFGQQVSPSESIVTQLVSGDPFIITTQDDAGGIVWRDLSVSARNKVTSYDEPENDEGSSRGRGVHERLHEEDEHNYIVHPCSGLLANGKVCAVIGPSGSGKTTFLSAIAGLLPSSAVDGLVMKYSKANGKDVSKARRKITLESIPKNRVGWIQQHDDFFTQLTVRETLELAAFLESPNQSASARSIAIQKIAISLGLDSTLDRTVGKNNEQNHYRSSTRRSSKQQHPNFLQQVFTRPQKRKSTNSLKRDQQRSSITGGRLSGGERRRLSFALELLNGNQVLFVADEPTTGLDSRMSSTVMNIIHKFAAERNIPALCSLHQPRSSIWNQLDSIILLAPGGKVCYSGERGSAIEYFAGMGYRLPKDTNPVEFLIDLVSIDPDDPDTAAADVDRIDSLARNFTKYQMVQWTKLTQSAARGLEASVKPIHHNHHHTSQYNNVFKRFVLRIGALFRRSWRQNTRDINLTAVRFLSHILNGLLLCGIFPTVKHGQIPLVNSIADRVAMLSFSAINLGMNSYMNTATMYIREKSVIQREQRKSVYSAFEYLFAKALVEVPLDCIYSLLLTTVLKLCTGIMIGWKALSISYFMMTVASASLGFLIGSIAPNEQASNAIGIPTLVVLMVVGVINPSGVDPNKPPPMIVRILKLFSPFAYVIEALCLGEYPGVVYQFEADPSRKRRHLFSRMKNIQRMGGLALVTTGDQVVDALGLKGKTMAGSWKHLALLSSCNFIMAWFLLHWQQLNEARRQIPQPRKIVETKNETQVRTQSQYSSSTKTSPIRVPTRIRF